MRRQTMTLAQFERYVGELPDELEAAVKRGLRNAARRGAAIVREEIRDAKLEDTGALLESVRARGAEIEVDAPHAPHMEYGTKPHMPPVSPLFLWVMRKGLAASETEGRRVAWRIAKGIAKRGTKPRWYFRKAMVRIRTQIVPEEVQKEVQKI